ncbi:alpha-amylase [Arthrobacter alpinus]|uniref:glycoside hydrolase family 13 protein n=1 Tax=Arthrobacter alpinus TaxID=656366 RepID=UPI0005C9543E|nr:glycoside hydrolase family 13 protein [Arthrobacter alpinus]ALV46616.1 alpha-amylase [Arthrobacter alpinus]
MSTFQPTPAKPWWASAVIYQIYPRSFADGNGDGMGDLSGISEKLEYLAALGINAIWLSPFYLSPQADAGYDVADYRRVDPLFGELQDFDEMLSKAHSLGLRVIVDLVPNHTSDEHAWFQEALASPSGSPARDRYMFRDGRGIDGVEPPNNWRSIFGGGAWTRVTENGVPGQWYLHLFDTKQPDLNWENPEVHAEMESVLRFWLDRGVDGFRVDVAHGMVKAAGLPDWEGHTAMVSGDETNTLASQSPAHQQKPAMDPPSPFFDQDGVHEIYRAWNRVLKEYDGDRMLVAEAWVEQPERLALYVRPDEMQQAFNFDFLLAGWDAQRMATAVDNSLLANAAVGAPATWVLSNHDTVRHTSRFGLLDPTAFPKGISTEDEQPDEALGLARARAATLLMLALPGSAYVYQGEELGLPEHTTLEAAFRQDPSFFRTNGVERGRDGCRVPLPWKASEPGYGFSSGTPKEGRHAAPWLPQPPSFAHYAADTEAGVAGSTVELYRSALEVRAAHALGEGTHAWAPQHDPGAGVVAFSNGPITVLVNTGSVPLDLPPAAEVVLASTLDSVSQGKLAPNSAVWIAS